jgi:hypothetical protein
VLVAAVIAVIIDLDRPQRGLIRVGLERMVELQNKLEEYLNKERQIAEVMVNAQISAQKIEAQARTRAEILLQETDEELRRKNQELELLQIKAQKIKKNLATSSINIRHPWRESWIQPMTLSLRLHWWPKKRKMNKS